jgi:ABC-type uncharacterized transport system substrate-binding protein
MDGESEDSMQVSCEQESVQSVIASEVDQKKAGGNTSRDIIKLLQGKKRVTLDPAKIKQWKQGDKRSGNAS